MEKNTLIIPYRNRKEDFDFFIENTVNKFPKNFNFLIVEQSDKKLFNRGKLLNVGYLNIDTNIDNIITQDIDVNPLEKTINIYNKIANNKIIGIYNNSDKPNGTLGGIVKIPVNIYKRVNGFSNDFWGWGAEDKNFQNRVEYYNISFEKNILKQKHNISEYFLVFDRYKRDIPKEFNNRRLFEYNIWKQVANKHEIIKKSGINNCEFTILKEEQIKDRVKKITVNI